MHRELTTVSDVLEALGGIQAVADLTGSKYKAVAARIALGSFPSKHYLVMTAALERVGMTAPVSLWSMTEVSEPERAAS